MEYLLKIRLCGYVCDNCSDNLDNIKVSLYRSADANVASLAAANPKATFAELDDKQLKERQSSLLAEGVTDENGKLDLVLEKGYEGGAFDVVIHMRAAGQDGKEYHFYLTTLAPTWRKYVDSLVAVWDYCLPQRIYCWILARLGLWVICGQVIHCKTQQPIGGVKVSAFDRDWLQDDALGSALTDATGHFYITYTKDDFTPGTWVNVELFGGPDLYFQVHHPLGAPLLIEPPAKGREPGRENAGHCFCVTLCLEEVPQEEDYPPPVFTHVGGYNHQSQIDTLPGHSGLTLSDGRAFYTSIRLNGTLPKKYAGGPMEYRFEVSEVKADGTVISGWTPIDLAKVSRTVIGQLLTYAPLYPGDPNPIKSEDYTVNGNPGEKEATVVAGWIQVPQESNTFGPSGYFQPNGNQIRLNTQLLGGWTDLDLSGVQAGSSSTATGVALAHNRYFGLRMRVRKVGDPASETIAGVCQQLAINNTLYDNILRHPAWMPQSLSNQLGVVMLDIQQLIDGGGCSEIGNDLDVKFTAAHPTLGTVAISMSGPGGPYSFNLPAAVPGERYGVATPNGFAIADLSPCAYIVTLSVQFLLTTGDHIPDNRYDQIAFCKA